MNKWTNTVEHWKHIHTCRDKKRWVSNFGTSKNRLKRCWNMFWHVFGSHLKAPTRVCLGYPGSDAVETVVCDQRTMKQFSGWATTKVRFASVFIFEETHVISSNLCQFQIYIYIQHIQHIHHIHHIPISSISSRPHHNFAAGESPHPRSC